MEREGTLVIMEREGTLVIMEREGTLVMALSAYEGETPIGSRSTSGVAVRAPPSRRFGFAHRLRQG